MIIHNFWFIRPELSDAFTKVGAFPLQLPPDLSGGTPDQNRQSSLGDIAFVTELQPGTYSVAITPRENVVYTDTNPVGLDANGFSGASGMVLLEVYDASPDSTGRLANVSARGKIEAGARQMIVGFVISGSGHRRLLVRGLGPALKSFGMGNPLDDTTVTIFDSTGRPGFANDDWTASTWADQSIAISTQVDAFALGNTSKDSAILARLSPGSYAIAVKSATAQIGVGLVEIYESP